MISDNELGWKRENFQTQFPSEYQKDLKNNLIKE